MQSFHSAHFNYYELTLTSEERGSFFIPFFLCFYTFVKVRAIKLYSFHMISWSDSQERNRLTRQNVIPKAGCWGERGGKRRNTQVPFLQLKYYAGRQSTLAHCRNVFETWWILYLLLTFNDQDFDQPSNDTGAFVVPSLGPWS